MPKRQLTEVQVTHVSFVDKGANQKTFFLTKSADEAVNVVNKVIVPITKEDDAQKIVYGVVYSPDEIDSQGDFMEAGEIEKSAHYFLAEHRKIDKQHNFADGYGNVVESYIAPADMTIGEQEITKGSWILAVKANDEIWEDIQKGEITGFSLAGTATVIEIEKASVKDIFAKRLFDRNIYALMDALHDTFNEILWDGNSLDTIVDDFLVQVDEFTEILKDLKTDPGKAVDLLESHKQENSDSRILDVLKSEIESIIETIKEEK